ncbi:hypothetical protein PQR64_33810 [Paraburkholderia phytofirmans]|uniref:hypothetical protein n=1 Tax=Paraburkholderia phytofirmans TaxID=261302 RepID=UPI0038BAF398
MPIPLAVDQLLSDKRLRKASRRRWRQTKGRARLAEQRRVNKLRFGDHSRIVRMLAECSTAELKLPRTGAKVVVPPTFSIIDDPVTALQVILSFAKLARDNRLRSIEIDHSRMQVCDLAANAVLDLVASELSTEARQRGSKIRFFGRYPIPTHLKRFVQCIGIVKQLSIAHEVPSPEEKNGVRIFDKRKRHYHDPIDPTQADFKSRVAVDFVDHINGCLNDHGRALTPAAVHKLCVYIGEILGNAEDHAGFEDWTIQGYLDNAVDTPMCEIAIFNFGASIAETLSGLPADCYTWRQISSYVLMHRGAKLFRVGWRERDLLTLIALQGNVSSKNHSEKDTRGQGTVDLIEFFQKVYEECAKDSRESAKMAILSGSTHILFDGKYRLGGSSARGKVIAFNAENTLYKQPDSSYVRSLGALKFPGTIISIRFPLSTASTVALGVNRNEPNRD